MEFSCEGNDLLPLAIFVAPENCRYHAASKVLGLSQIQWLSLSGANPNVAHGVGAYHLIKSPPSCLCL
jgi:hypothetical protein